MWRSFEKSSQSLLALQEGHAPQITAIEVEQIERVEEEPRRLTISEFAPQCVKVWKTSDAENGCFAIDDGLSNLELRRGISNTGKHNSPVVLAAVDNLSSSVTYVKLRAVNVGLDVIG